MAGETATIADFKPNDGDVIDISDILVGYYDPLTQSINDFVQMQAIGNNTIIKVDIDGTGTAQGWAQLATVGGVLLDLNISLITHHLEI